MITYEDFVDCSKSIEKRDYSPVPEYRFDKTTEIWTAWAVGGKRGGDCWGGESKKYRGEPEPDFFILDDLLEKTAPSISFLQYKKLTQTLVNYSEWSDNEYYGNSNDYKRKFVNLKELHNYLIREEVLIDSLPKVRPETKKTRKKR